MPQSWKRSRNAALWRRLKPAEAVRVLADCYGDGAGAEVLLRAFLAERDMNRHNVRFWLRVAITFALTLTGVAEASWLGVRASRQLTGCLLYTSPSPRDGLLSRMPSSA